MGQTLQKLLINWSMFNSKKNDELGTYLGIGFKNSFRNLMQRVEGSLNSTIEVLNVFRVMAFVFAAFMLVSQILTIYSLMMVSKRVRAIETKSENNNANYSSQHTNLSLRGINTGPESVKSSKVPTTLRTNHLYTEDEVLGL